ncbi:MAG: peroxide stress protein YaaA [Flavobacteriales bacterium]|nr:peroxide stress protein YaaA [Flavobacteriales bacterium]
MLILLSPAKTLDPKNQGITESASQPLFLEEADYLVNKLKKFSAKKLEKMYKVSPDIAAENHERFQMWSAPFHLGNSRQAVLTFKGEVYRGLQAEHFLEQDFEFAQKHLRILSGLYGVLRPLDLMQAYRLEMGTSWAVSPTKKNLYKFWGNKLTDKLNNSETQGPIINLASNEYFKAVNTKELNREIITCHFKDNKNGEYKALMTYAKHARGLMARFIIKNKLTNPEDLKAFDLQGYSFNPRLSETNELVFTRDQVPTT